MKNTDRFIKLAKEGKVKESTLYKMSDFKDQLDKIQLTKKANILSSLGNIGEKAGPVLLLSAALAGVPALGNYIVDKVQDASLDRKKEPAFNKMLEYHPQLKSEDLELVKRYFESMWHFSPHMAQDPLAAGSYIRTAMNFHGAYGGPAPNLAADLVDLQKNYTERRVKNIDLKPTYFNDFYAHYQQPKLDS